MSAIARFTVAYRLRTTPPYRSPDGSRLRVGFLFRGRTLQTPVCPQGAQSPQAFLRSVPTEIHSSKRLTAQEIHQLVGHVGFDRDDEVPTRREGRLRPGDALAVFVGDDQRAPRESYVAKTLARGRGTLLDANQH